MGAALFSFDTSGWIDPWRRHQPRDIFESMWERIDDLIEQKAIVSCEMVHDELSRKDDDIYKYTKGKNGLFVPLNDSRQMHVQSILTRFPNWISPNSTKNQADPFTIALAMDMGLTVVAYEKGGSNVGPKIPYVCNSFNVPYLHFVDFLRHIGYRG